MYTVYTPRTVGRHTGRHIREVHYKRATGRHIQEVYLRVCTSLSGP